MANLTIAQLSASLEILPTDLLPIYNQGITRKVDIEKLFSRVQTEYVPLSGGAMFGDLALSGNLVSFAKIVSGGRELFDIFDTLDKGDQLMRSVSGLWMSNYNTTSTLSSYWNAVYATVDLLSANWVSVYNNVQSLSSEWNTTYSTVLLLSAEWNSVYGNVNELSANWNSVHGTVLPLSANWNAVYETVLPLSADWNSVYGNVNELSANWNSVHGNVNELSANWNSVYGNVNDLSANWDSVYSNVQTYSGTYQFLPLSGGSVDGVVEFNNNVTIKGTLSAVGETFFANTYYTTTSALSVVHTGGDGPALYVGNDGSGSIASFYDIDQNVEVLHVGGENSLYPNVGVKTSTPNEAFTVNGNISSANVIYDELGNSTQWNRNYTTTTETSATWDTAYFALSTQPYLYNPALSSIQTKLGNNIVSGSYSSVLGGRSNNVSGQCSNINGGCLNTISDNAGVIGGGLSNTISDFGSVVGGGVSNSASGYGSSIAGGKNNTVSGYHSNIGAGLCNTASGDYSVVNGGVSNDVSGNYSSVNGGKENTASGNYSAVLGGKNNSVQNNNSFVIGSDITTTEDNTTYVNNLSTNGNVNGNNLLIGNWDSVYNNTNALSATWVTGPTKKFEFVDFITYQITYSGIAPFDTPETATEWKITRLTMTTTGSVTATERASNVAWENRQNVIYT